MAKGRRARDNLESGSARRSKTIANGFGIVRMLTKSSQSDVAEILQNGQLSQKNLKRRLPFHATVIGFVGMSRSEQGAFNAGFSVARLEEKFENGVALTTPRQSVSVELGEVATIGNFIYCEIYNEQLEAEQRELAGQVALHGINASRINKRIMSPHMGVGWNQTKPIGETMERVQELLPGQVVALERWKVYPSRYV